MKKRFLSVVLCLCMVVGMVPAIITTAKAYSTGDNYPYKSARCGTYTNDTEDEWNFYYRECTSFVAWCLNDRNGISFSNRYRGVRWGNASNWGAAARSLGIPVDATPAVGAVAWFDANAHGAAGTGHVAWVSAVNGDNVTIEEYRRPSASNGWTDFTYNTRTISRSNVSGYIHIKDIGGSALANVTVNWSDYNRHSISTTSPTATLARRATISGASVSSAQCGIYLYNSSGALVASKREGVAPANGIVNMWYDVAGELGYSLTAGASYTYKFVLSFNGKDYYSPTYSFTAGGSPAAYTIKTMHTAGGMSAGGGTYASGKSVTVYAASNSGYIFKGWMENNRIVSTEPVYNFIASANRTLTAVFEKDQVSTPSYTITVIAADGGTVTGGGQYDYLGTAWLKASPNEGYRFVGWMENGSILSNSTEFGIVVRTNRILTAVFEKDTPTTYIITVNATIGGRVFSDRTLQDVFSGGTFQKGTKLTIFAVPYSSNSVFKCWTENGKTVCTTNEYSFTVDADRTLTAVFEAKEAPAEIYSIDVSASPSAGGTVTGGGSYVSGKSATVKAAANSGYTFKGWTENGSTVSTNANYTFTVSANRTLTAVFEKGGVAAPIVTTWPTAAAVNYGQTLASSALSGGKASVSGTFQWNNSSVVPKAGQSYDITFIPSDTTKYNAVSGKASVTVNKSTPALSLSAFQSGTAVTVTASASNPYNAALTDVPTPAVTYRIGNGAAQNVAGGSFAIPEGTVNGTVITITASTVENGNYRAAEKSTTLTVTGATNKTSHYVLTTSGSDLGGSVSVQPASARQGDTVTVSVVPRNGYRLETVTATDANGAAVSLTSLGGGRYTFIMPDSNVTLDVVFEATQDGWINPFSDIAEGAWYYDAVKFVSQNGLMNGNNGVFDHSGNLSRAMIAQILYNKEGRPMTAAGQVFSDVAVDKWYADAVSWASGKKLIFGNEKGLFLPDNPVTREELAVILWRYEGSPTTSGRTLNFTDAGRISGYAREAVGWAVANGIISGKGGGVLDPKGPATRAQVAQMLKNYFGS